MVSKVAEPTSLTLEQYGIQRPGKVLWNADVPVLMEEFIRRGEGIISPGGGLRVTTGKYTGRSPGDKFVVQEEPSQPEVWWGAVNQPFTPEKFEALRRRVLAYLQDKDLFVQDVTVGADPAHCMPIRVISEVAWVNVFVRHMFRDPGPTSMEPFTIIHAPNFQCVPEIDGTKSEVGVILSFTRRLAIIAGSQYAGECKKSVFTVLNYLLPKRNVLSMHCSANEASNGETAIFFGLSGTGKTTLTADTERALIGDDEHGWSDNGVFNFEGGCYAKMINLSQAAEPDIYAAIHMFGSILENVVIDPVTRKLDLDSEAITENTRASYPLESIRNASATGMGGHPKNVIFLTADAFGVLPPISRLTTEQALYHFISGYTARVAGTEKGMGSEPQATFSACFGAPFLVLHPSVYADKLGERIRSTGARCWLVNTGWSGGPYGVGKRFSIPHTRAMLRAALSGQLENVSYRTDPTFGFKVPETCPDVPDRVLRPRDTWADKAAYDVQMASLAGKFVANFKQFADRVADDVKAAGPKV
ncbi:MAG: phosphoenolpyruvate carboxykinase (ATP) [Dehalococcoidia bacterium]|nr:phosphoenolpyruvate carboxykinase (ATP) [Dehalococcoidia bacterium]